MALFNRKTRVPALPTNITSLTASGQDYRVASYADATHLSLLRQNWQDRAYAVYGSEGHLFYATNYIGQAFSRIKLVAAVLPEVGDEYDDPKVIGTGPIADAVASISSVRGGQSSILRQVGRNIFLTGEVWLIGNGQSWSTASVKELVTGSGGSSAFMFRALPGAQPQPLDPNTLKIRIWRESPDYSELADSGVRSCIELLEKVIVLNRAEKAVARSRMAGSGILGIPQELVPPAWQNQNRNADPMESNPLYMALAESMTAPLSDESHPAAVVPLVIVGPAEAVSKIKYEPIERTFDAEAAQASITNAVEQIANTLELPKEVLLGMGDVNHWSLFTIREETFQAHIRPMIELVCTALTKTFLQQALVELTKDQLLKAAGTDDINRIVVWFDASDLVFRPDKGEKAIALHDRLVISDSALRREAGFPDSDTPDKGEYARRVGLKVADPKMALTGTPTEPTGPGPVESAANSGGGVRGPKASAPDGAKARRELEQALQKQPQSAG